MEGFDGGDLLSQEKINELLKNPPQPVSFRYSVDDIAQAIANFEPSDSKSTGNIIEDYQDDYYNSVGSLNNVARAVYRFYSMPFKNNIYRVREIIEQINNNLGSNMQMPEELSRAISDIKRHKKYLDDISTLKLYNAEQEKQQQQEQQTQNEQVNQEKEQQIQEARFNEIQSKLPLINEKLNHMRESLNNNDIYKKREIELLKERNYFYHRKNNILQEDMDRLNNYLATLDSIEQEIINSNQQPQQVEQPTIQEQQPNLQEQEQINQLKAQIQQYDNQIAMLLANIQPYMQIPKVNQEISKVVKKNNEINEYQITSSLQDYEHVAEIKQSLVTYLEQANSFIKDNIEKQQHVQPEPVAQEQTTQSLSEEFWKEFERSEEENPQQPLPADFWDEFDKPDPSVKPERIYNDDGTYTIEYITYLATTPLGFNKDIYDQLMQENETKRQQGEEQMTSSGRHM